MKLVNTCWSEPSPPVGFPGLTFVGMVKNEATGKDFIRTNALAYYELTSAIYFKDCDEASFNGHKLLMLVID